MPVHQQLWVTVLDYHYQPLITRLLLLEEPGGEAVWSPDAADRALLRTAWRFRISTDPNPTVERV
jgi:hypothetical protein